MAGKEYGYIRVSSKDQNEDRQVLALLEFGIEPASTYVDEQSGIDFNRPQYKRPLRKLKHEDTLVIKSIDIPCINYTVW